MNNNKNIFRILFLMLSFYLACSSNFGGKLEKSLEPLPPYVPKVYSGGSMQIEPERPCYWVDVDRHDIEEPHGGNINSIFVLDDAVYTAGGFYDNADWLLAKYYPSYWVGQIKTTLDASEGDVYSIFVKNSTVYSAGYYRSGLNSIPCYWEGTIRKELLPTGAVSGEATGITINDSSAYISGYYIDASDNVHYCYWKNADKDNPVVLASIIPAQRVNSKKISISIYYADSTVYTAGDKYYKETADPSILYSPYYWVNSNATALDFGYNPRGDYDQAYVMSIFVNKEIVYSSGFQNVIPIPWHGNEEDFNLPCYWKGNQLVDLSMGYVLRGVAKSISVYDANVYVGGHFYRSGNPNPCYWINNGKINLPLKTGYERGRVNSIFVK